MHFHLPKPLHGWREFVGEVGIIVIGVLIALGAEQVMEMLHWRHSAALARDSLSEEIQGHYFAASEIALAQPCIDRQLQAIEQAVLAPGPFRPVPSYSEGAITFAFRAPSRPWSDYIWQSVSNDGTASHFDPQQRIELARFYGLVDGFREQNTMSNSFKWKIDALARPIQLDTASRAQFVSEIEQARGLYALMALSGGQVIERGEAAGFKPDAENLRADDSGTLAFCRAHHLPLGRVESKT